MVNTLVRPEKLLLDTAEVASLLGISAREIQRMVASGEFPPPRIKKQRCVRWAKTKVENWVGEIEKAK